MDIEVKKCDHCGKWGKEDRYLNMGWISLDPSCLDKAHIVLHKYLGRRDNGMGKAVYKPIEVPKDFCSEECFFAYLKGLLTEVEKRDLEVEENIL